MEVAGLVLGAIPILIGGIDAYRQLYGEWDGGRNLLEKRRRQLSIENIKLRQTLRHLSPDLDTETIEHSILFWDREERETVIGTVEDLKDSIYNLMEQLDLDEKGAPRSNSRAKEGWKRMKRSFKKKETLEAFDEVSRYNENLRLCFEAKREVSSDMATNGSSQQSRRFNTKACQQLRKDLFILHAALNGVHSHACANIHPSMVDLAWYRQGLKTTNNLTMLFPDRDTCCQTTWSWQGVRVDIERCQPVAMCLADSLNSMCTDVDSTHAKRARFGALSKTANRSPNWSSNSITDMTQAASPIRPIPKDQILTACSTPREKFFNGFLRYSDDSEEFEINFEKRCHSAKPLDILPWRALLTSPVGSGIQGRLYQKRKMSRKDSLAIASAATWSVLLLCGTPWLDETRLGTDDITLLVQGAPGAPDMAGITKASPAFRFNFSASASTFGGQGETTRSPNSMIPHRALFALAILLLEIGMDQKFSDMCGTPGSLCSGPMDDDVSLLESYNIADSIVEDLYDVMGDPYTEAVKRCLHFNFEGRKSMKNFGNESLRQQFFNGVVVPVQERYEQEQTRHKVLNM